MHNKISEQCVKFSCAPRSSRDINIFHKSELLYGLQAMILKTNEKSILVLDRINETTPVRVYIGDVAEIKCKEPKSNPPATVSWQVNGTNLTKTSRIDPSGWTLKINNVSSNDAGRYTCIARNDPLLRDAKTNLTVISKSMCVPFSTAKSPLPLVQKY